MISFEGKCILAPMVRIGTLPMRLLALYYGADIVYSPEIIDKKIIGSIRVYNNTLNTYDYIKDNVLIFRTAPKEKEKLIFQIGSSDPELALLAASLIKEDVSGIDLNCGCPKWFSIHAGMGAALLSTPEKLCSILRTLVDGIPDRPISCKIRLLPNKEKTIELIHMIKNTGIKALTVHCRTPSERPEHPANWGYLELISEIVHPLPLIVNGDIFNAADIDRVFSINGVKSIMIARAAQWNASIFSRKESLIDLLIVSKKYLEYCIDTGNGISNSKYSLLQMWTCPHNKNPLKKHFIKGLQESKSMQSLCILFQIDYRENYNLPEYDSLESFEE